MRRSRASGPANILGGGTVEGHLCVGDAVGGVLTLDGDPGGLGVDVVQTIDGRHDEPVGDGTEGHVGLDTADGSTADGQEWRVHITDEFVQRHRDDALARGEPGEMGRGVLGEERCSHAHDGEGRHLRHRATDLLEDDAHLGEPESGATLGLGHADTDDAEVGEFTPQGDVDAAVLLDILEMFHGAAVGEDAADEPAQFFLIR